MRAHWLLLPLFSAVPALPASQAGGDPPPLVELPSLPDVPAAGAPAAEVASAGAADASTRSSPTPVGSPAPSGGATGSSSSGGDTTVTPPDDMHDHGRHLGHREHDHDEGDRADELAQARADAREQRHDAVGQAQDRHELDLGRDHDLHLGGGDGDHGHGGHGGD